MKPFLNKYFDFTRSELNGLLFLIFLIVFVTVLPTIYVHFKPDETLTNDEQSKIIALELSVEKFSAKSNNVKSGSHEFLRKGALFVFDPNKIGIDEWQKLGLSLKQAQSIVNYRSKGGRFFKPEDLQKMYTIRPELYQEFLPYVQITPSNDQARRDVPDKEKQYKKSTFTIVDINAADTSALDGIKGIGAAFARRIVAYRERLGGFYNTAQLMEVYGIDSAKYLEISDQVKITAGIRKININSATFDELKNHPYLRYKQINAIIQYRKQHGNFSGVADLKKIILLPDETIQKITPYLTF